MKNKIILYVIAITAGSIAACSILKKDDGEKEIRKFVASFQNSLVGPDEIILSQFETTQSQQEILSIIKVLQNKESDSINCVAAFDKAWVTTEEGKTKIDISVAFNATFEDDNHQFDEKSSLVLWITPHDESFVITKIEGESFYKTFAAILNKMRYSTDQSVSLEARKPIYKIARMLENSFDSVVWFSVYNNKKYFYVVTGHWDQSSFVGKQRDGYKMGLVDEHGSIIIPIEYELIGTIGFEQKNIIEVKKQGKVGYFDVATKKMLIAPAYDYIIPYRKDQAVVIVKTDSMYAWMDANYQYHEGFPSVAAENWIHDFEFIPDSLVLQNGNQAFCEIPDAQYVGNGLVMPSSYLVHTNIFQEIEQGISTTPTPMNGWTEYKETSGTWLHEITDNIRLLVTNVREHYLEGREQFYENDRLVFVNQANDTLNLEDFPYQNNLTVKRIDSLVEISTEGGYGLKEDRNVPHYNYYKVEENDITKLETHRRFSPSQFVRLDSSYLSGNFYTEDEEIARNRFLSLKTVRFIRNEILADYGYIFSEEELDGHHFPRWYKPRYEKIVDFKDQLTEIDRYNLAFLEKILKLMEKNRPA